MNKSSNIALFMRRKQNMRNIKLTIEYDGKDFGRVAKTA